MFLTPQEKSGVIVIQKIRLRTHEYVSSLYYILQFRTESNLWVHYLDPIFKRLTWETFQGGTGTTEVGSIKSKLLCKSILDLYCGEEAFDKQAKEEIEHNVASYL
ncbi:hypothetical protein V8G54_018901 [Vigna mungo]|uniref:Uncharacterized protein n=1 Tax=Vigna mungo TaxID=3915 RepID=A0AAQ3N9K5_VIGMU